MTQLLVLGCSSRKTKVPGKTPALHRYDGPFYQDFRSKLRNHVWPTDLDVAVLSAEYGMIGALTEIPDYDRRMSKARANELAPRLSEQVGLWLNQYDKINLCLGKDYMEALPVPALENSGRAIHFKGGIGHKRQQLGGLFDSLSVTPRTRHAGKARGRMSYYLPDWDDLLDKKFDFKNDKFSGPKGEREDVHCARLMRPYKIADGILVSLAQKRESKGPLKYVGGLDHRTLRPIDLRTHYALDPTQSLFGDCGAFSYVNENIPPISVDYAVSLYELYNFDFGASVDHIPVPFVKVDGEKKRLSRYLRQKRVNITVDNANEFITAAKKRKAGFVPVGTVQGLTPNQYVQNANGYVDMGYTRIALGGLVPLPDKLILEIVQKVMASLRQRTAEVDVHLFGVFRPRLQGLFRALGVTSFDSATYFRKAWLRSEQNYLSADGQWYAAIRVPMTSDGRTRNTMLKAGHDLDELAALETTALSALHDYGSRRVSLKAALEAVISYDSKLDRSSENSRSVAAKYERTLRDRPWEYCPCPVCQRSGIDVLIFRGSNRNKRRGAHNTWRLYQATRTAEKLSFNAAMGIDR